MQEAGDSFKQKCLEGWSKLLGAEFYRVLLEGVED